MQTAGGGLRSVSRKAAQLQQGDGYARMQEHGEMNAQAQELDMASSSDGSGGGSGSGAGSGSGKRGITSGRFAPAVAGAFLSVLLPQWFLWRWWKLVHQQRAHRSGPLLLPSQLCSRGQSTLRE